MVVNGDIEIERRAADWVVADDRGLTDSERASLEQWRALDPRHDAAFVRASAVWATAVGVQRPRAPEDQSGSFSPQLARRGFLAGGALAASVALTGVGVALINRRTYRTTREEVRRLALEDGSRTVMNADAEIAVRYSEQKRSVELREGEAWFQVEKDVVRPFVVTAGAATVTAVGTAFSVRKERGFTDVMVSEGVVKVRGPAGARTILRQGETMRLTSAQGLQVSRLKDEQLQRRLAWRDGLIMLDGERLGEAAEEFNRYSQKVIQVAPAISDERVVGVFNARDAEGFARASAQVLNVNIDVYPDKIVLGDLSSVVKYSQ
ncbi:FecR domain-containing protein [Brevundimonas bullata]|uniref:FecR family protein n=1 Tax=Brevundimonas bullata TaxID=13160 RepID=UPI000E0C6BD9|nr:FecR domain-containing protein [Brevundimonas bullata]WQE37985.1 FecR domain-containing protein [Brevundimonas bullata]